MPTIMLDPGMLRTELVLQQAVLADDGTGGNTQSWVETAVIFAHVEPLASRNSRRAGREIQETTHRITIRYRDGVEPGMRLVRNSRCFRIATVSDPDETGRYLVCRTVEDTP